MSSKLRKNLEECPSLDDKDAMGGKALGDEILVTIVEGGREPEATIGSLQQRCH